LGAPVHGNPNYRGLAFGAFRKRAGNRRRGDEGSVHNSYHEAISQVAISSTGGLTSKDNITNPREAAMPMPAGSQRYI
jgi:hypothetical protein